ncbi:hypothetical protein J6590_023901 [Homalodisca vitripennis]|nr:hypothetical protein J6590_023901 [Homalodisca vitripennis]
MLVLNVEDTITDHLVRPRISLVENYVVSGATTFPLMSPQNGHGWQQRPVQLVQCTQQCSCGRGNEATTIIGTFWPSVITRKRVCSGLLRYGSESVEVTQHRVKYSVIVAVKALSVPMGLK